MAALLLLGIVILERGQDTTKILHYEISMVSLYLLCPYIQVGKREKMSFQEKLLGFMREKAYRPLTIDELARELGLHDRREIRRFTRLADELEQAGKIIKTRYGRYGVPEKMNLAVGRLQGNPAGFGFILPDGPSEGDVFIPAGQLNGALHGDRVVARLSGSREGGKREGEIIRILERRSRYVIGRLESVRQSAYVVPDEQRISTDILIPRSQARTLKNGLKVQVEITRWPEKRRPPEGVIVSVLGEPGDRGLDTLTIIKKYELPEAFPAQVLKEVAALPGEITPQDLEGRRDLRALPAVTIDGADARDLDDAVSLRQLDNGSLELGVHIADVGHFVREGSALDREAFLRGTSVYLVDAVIPMLPPELSNDLCSLNPRVDRLAVSVLMELDAGGQPVKYDFTPSVINSRERMTYEDLRAILEERDESLSQRYAAMLPMFTEMGRLALVLRGRRFERGAIDFDLPEIKVVLDDSGRPAALKRRPRSIAETIIEEFMLLCNEVVAAHFSRLQVPFLYRVHERPGEEKMIAFRDFVHNLGYSIKGHPEKMHSRALQALLEHVTGKPEQRVVNTLLLRSMKQARYSAEHLPHFGLAAADYTHFTSPIRRYPDLVVHRLLREYLAGMPGPRRLARLARHNEAAAEHSSGRERLAMEAERESVEVKKIEFMTGKEGQEYDAIISGVTSFGFFVELDNLVEGLVHVSTLADDYYRFNEKTFSLHGERTGKTFRIGQAVRVALRSVDKDKRQLDFTLLPR
jgi:ribonuclease R